MDAVASRVEAAVKMKQVTKQMSGVVKGMDKVSVTAVALSFSGIEPQSITR